jgi:hypothetical protein
MTEGQGQREPSYEFRNLANGMHEYFISLAQAGFSDEHALTLVHMFAMTQILTTELEEGEEGEDPLGPWRP